MEGPVIPVSMPMFSFGSDFKNVYKTIKNSNCSVEEDDGAANNISQQYSNHGNFNRWIDTDSRHSDISSAAFGFLNKPKEISLAVMSNFRVYIILTLAEEKKKKIVEQCQFLLSKPPVTIKELTRVIGRLASTAIGVLPAPLQYWAV